ncbi:DUF1934 family protein [Staphylococcus sp. SQ8-PEA]|uniref:DUF1934 family protein n=1 Tax=Staphylococcus marylandisciuri TaxID=2981529 RepID=A0ABT2QSC0_9STAP|nr:DUF1934 family protein [Staphylococcus marylandisciuri]MCU5746880.1 DUF1934 family protein [Staphylococcus marylandisciuri]
MEKTVHIQTHQVVKQFGNKDKFETTTEGTWHKKGSEYIRYQENVERAQVNVTVKIDRDSVKIIRKGDINMKLHFIEGEETTTLYDVSAGRVPLRVTTQSIKHYVHPTGGKLKIQYQLFQAEEKMGTYQFEIQYKETE